MGLFRITFYDIRSQPHSLPSSLPVKSTLRPDLRLLIFAMQRSMQYSAFEWPKYALIKLDCRSYIPSYPFMFAMKTYYPLGVSLQAETAEVDPVSDTIVLMQVAL